ncbi:MAG: hypothetical protein HY308_13790 [Gammaproteobacteria bacterium]|nr:hypothetical protein [Gammaproteobacteria bacterium]
MRTIKIDEIGEKLEELLREQNPIDEDVAIVDAAGNRLGVVIPDYAYQFLLKKTEEEEDKKDRKTIDEFRKSGEAND